MTVQVDNGLREITVHTVADLYREFDAMDVPAYYQEGGVNPFAGRCRVIPRKASFYVLVQERNEGRVELARRIMKGIAGRRKVREKVCSKAEINYNQFAPAGSVLVLYV